MERQEILERVKSVTKEVIKTEEEISDDANFIFDLGADSMQSVMLVSAFEEEFDVDLDEDKALQIQTVAEAADFIKQYIK
ncbi:acyl carrier protein [bacterium]|nr:acyl carrier protein [bacterium]